MSEERHTGERPPAAPRGGGPATAASGGVPSADRSALPSTMASTGSSSTTTPSTLASSTGGRPSDDGSAVGVPPVDDGAAYAHLPVAACGLDAEGRVRSWNTAATHLLGWPADDVLGCPAPFLGRGTAMACDPDGDGSGGSDLQVVDLRGDGLGSTREIRAHRRDGSTCWLSVTAREAVGDPAGAPGTWVFLVDVSDTHRSRASLAADEKTWRIMFRNLSDGVTVTGADGRIIHSSGEVMQLLGYSPDAWVGADAISFLHEDDRPAAREVLAQLLQAPGRPFRQVFRTRRADGSYDDIEYTVINHLDDPLVEGLIIVTRNVTAIRAAEALLSAEAEVLEMIATDAPLSETTSRIADMVAHHTDSPAAVLRLDGPGLEVLGASHGLDDVVAGALTELSVPWLTSGADERGGVPARVEHRLDGELPLEPTSRRALGRLVELGARTLHVATVTDRDEAAHAALCWVRSEPPDPRRRDDDVAEVAGHLIEIAVGRARSRRSLEHAARHHDLTRLPNRRVVLEHIEESLDRSRAGHGVAAVVCIDIDRFKVVNDSLGHAAGDRLLARVAGRLRRLVDGDDLVGHFAADEFVVVLAPPSPLERAVALAADVERALSEPFALPEGEVYLSASVGIATTDTASSTQESAEELFQHADAALARAKKLGRSRVEVFDGVLRDEALGQLRLERDLRLAVDRGELAVHYQLEWDVATGRPVGAEALLRWDHPERGVVMPAEFIDLAEDTGLIRRIGRWVLEESLREARRWADEAPGLDHFFMSVNLSARQLTSTDLVDSVRRVLDAYRWPADQLMLELTESVLIDERDVAFEVLGELKALGVCLALDDFGTGFSSLNYLHRFPVDVVKIDRSFIGDLDHRGAGSPVVTAVLQVADALGLTTCAEGVERPDQLEGLRRLGCDWAQGFHLGRPGDGDRIIATLRHV